MALVAALGCGSKSSEPAKQEPPPAAPAKPEAKGSSAAPTPAKADKAKPEKKLTKEQLAEFKKRMKAGWAMQKDNKWAEAIPEFEAALVASASDQRALTELGWSALQAGDFPKAKKATEQAVRLATDKKVKAAALYNLGLVHEKTNDKDAALKSFLASLALRPNAIVEKAVGRLGATPDKVLPFCAPGKKLCDCVLADAFDEIQLEQSKCEGLTDKGAPAGFKIVKVSSDAFYSSDYTYLFDDAGREMLGVIGGTDDRGRHTSRIELVKAEKKTIGGHSILWLETKDIGESMYGSMDGDSMNADSTETTLVTLCVLGDAKTPPRCPLKGVPIKRVDESGKIDSETADIKRTETVLDLTIADDGTATLKLVKGASDEQIAKLVGPHKLWQ
jgi:hypothetical protein